jgi:peptidase E
MVTLYFLGGEDVVKEDSREINKKAFIDAGGGPVVLVFPWTAESAETADKYRKMMADYFKELGASKIEFAELSDSLEEITRKMNRSDLVYLPGGVTKLLVQRIKDAKVDGLLRNYKKVIIGNSAGALALSKDCILTRDKDNPETTVISGFGLVDFSVEVHYNPSKDKELKKFSEERRIYAIPEKCALIFENGNLSFVGNVHLFYKDKKTKC